MLFAYIDPGSGSIILQTLLGGTAAVAVGLKFYWRRIRGFFTPHSREEE